MISYTLTVEDRKGRAAFEAKFSQAVPYFIHWTMNHCDWAQGDHDPASILKIMYTMGPTLYVLVMDSGYVSKDHRDRLNEMETEHNLSFGRWTSFRVEGNRINHRDYKIHVCYAFSRKEDAVKFQLFWRD